MTSCRRKNSTKKLPNVLTKKVKWTWKWPEINSPMTPRVKKQWWRKWIATSKENWKLKILKSWKRVLWIAKNTKKVDIGFCLEQLHFYTQHLPLQQYFSHLELLLYCCPSLTHLSMKEGCLFVLFCFVCTDEIHRIGMLQIAFLVSLESSWGGVHRLGFIVFGLVVQKFLNIEWFLHWKLN
jgi:hypothetical protein